MVFILYGLSSLAILFLSSQISDVGFPLADEAIVCGNEIEEPFLSLSNSVKVVFYSDGFIEGQGFSGIAYTRPCQQFAYVPGPPGNVRFTSNLKLQTKNLNP